MDNYMKRALELAREAFNEGEVPVGAVVVKKTTGKIVGELPIDKNRVTRRFLGVAAGVAAALLALLTFVF